MRSTLILAALSLFASTASAQTAADRQQLARELEEDVRAYRTGLPVRDGLLTITAVDLIGLEIVYTGNVATDFDPIAAEFRRILNRDLCSGSTGDVIRRGGAFTYVLRDTGGDVSETTVDRCDVATADPSKSLRAP